MNNSVLKTASFAILLTGLFLVVQGLWNGLFSFNILKYATGIGARVTSLTGFLVVLWQMLPVLIGIFLFRMQSPILRWFCRSVSPENRGRITWSDTGVVSSLAVGLAGLFLTARGVVAFTAEMSVLYRILSIDDDSLLRSAVPFGDRWDQPYQFLYPLIAGLFFVAGSATIGRCMGVQIDKASFQAEGPSADEVPRTGDRSR